MSFKARVQFRHGTYSQFDENRTTLLPDEFVIIDSGHPDTPNGSAAYYRPNGGQPVRIANANEINNVTIIDYATSIGWVGEIPDTYSGSTGVPGEIAFYSEAGTLWFLSGTDDSVYEWIRIAGKLEIESLSAELEGIRSAKAFSISTSNGNIISNSVKYSEAFSTFIAKNGCACIDNKYKLYVDDVSTESGIITVKAHYFDNNQVVYLSGTGTSTQNISLSAVR